MPSGHRAWATVATLAGMVLAFNMLGYLDLSQHYPSLYLLGGQQQPPPPLGSVAHLRTSPADAAASITDGAAPASPWLPSLDDHRDTRARLAATHDLIAKRHALYRLRLAEQPRRPHEERNTSRPSPYVNAAWAQNLPGRSPAVVNMLTMSDASMEQLWAGAREVQVLPCAWFDPQYCGSMSQVGLAARYEETYDAPRFYPSAEKAAQLYLTKPLAVDLGAALLANDTARMGLLRRGRNVSPPSIGVVYDGWVTQHGSLLSHDIFVPAWPDPPALPAFLRQFFPHHYDAWPANHSSPAAAAAGPIEWREVKEVVVISHLHQTMFWHWMVSEYYRIFALLPYLQANPHVYVHVAGGNKKLENAVFDLLRLPRDRMLLATHVKAEVIYYTQFIGRDDIPSLGLSQLVRHRLQDAIALPEHQRASVLLQPRVQRNPSFRPPPASEAHEVTILCIVRTNNYMGRMIANYGELKQALVNFTATYSARLRQSGGPRLAIKLTEHLPSMDLPQTLDRYARADIILGPHGAGFVNLFAVRPGAHVIELMTARHLNLLSSARLGLSYHGCIAALTNQGMDPSSRNANFVADVPQLVRLIHSILDSRLNVATSL